jgi:hypothetical protein
VEAAATVAKRRIMNAHGMPSSIPD